MLRTLICFKETKPPNIFETEQQQLAQQNDENHRMYFTTRSSRGKSTICT